MERQPAQDGRATDGRKGVAYLRDHFEPGLRADSAPDAAFAPDRAERAAVSPAPA
jgi:hypothetical protein